MIERWVKVFEAEESEETSIAKLSCLKEALEKNWVLNQIVYKCYFDSANICLYPERPKAPKTCQQFLCSKWLKRLAEIHILKGIVSEANTNTSIEVYVEKKHVSEVKNKILPAVHVKAELMKTVTKETGPLSTEQVYA